MFTPVGMADSERPKALLITRNLPPLVGGMERLVWHIVDELRASYSVHVIGPRGCARHLPSQVEATEVTLKPLWRFLSAGLWQSIVHALRRRPRLVFAGSGLTAPLAWLAARLSRGKCVVYLHGLDIETRHWGYRLLWHPFLRRCDRVIANSHFTHALAAEIGIPVERLEVLHPGVELPDLRTAEAMRARFRARHQLGEAPVMLYVGRITLRKGLFPFIEKIFPQVVDALPKGRLVVIGGEASKALLSEGGLLERIRTSLLSNKLQQAVIFTGELPVDDPDIHAAYFAADVLVFPVQDKAGDNEGFGMVAVEAAAHGLPTVAFAAGGVADAVSQGRSGQLVPAGDNHAFAHATIDLLSAAPPEKARIALATVEFARAFEWTVFGRRLRQLLQQSQGKGR